jgi:thiamine biosynthesis lipoprotein ApbE
LLGANATDNQAGDRRTPLRRATPRRAAACYAALAAAGQGEGARNLPDKERLMLRRQALAWVGALVAYTKLAERDDPKAKETVRQRLAHWQQDSDLASVRDKKALAKLDEDERRAWVQVWAEVAGLLWTVDETK